VGSGVGDVPPNPAPLLPSFSAVGAPDTVAAGVARQRPKAIPNQGCGGVTIPQGGMPEEKAAPGGWRSLVPGQAAHPLWPPLIDTIAHPRAPRPRRLTRQSRSSTLARVLSPSRRGRLAGRFIVVSGSPSRAGLLFAELCQQYQPAYRNLEPSRAAAPSWLALSLLLLPGEPRRLSGDSTAPAGLACLGVYP
jgi:hypothetical protein